MKKSKQACDLKSCFFCTQCLPDWLPAIASNRETFSYKKGETIFKEGEKVNGVYFVYEGKVKVHKQWGDKELIIRFANRGQIFGHRGLGHHHVYPVSATSLEPTLACFIGIDFFNSTLKVNHDFLFQLMLFFADDLQESERKMRNLAHMPVRGRLAQALLLLDKKFGKTETGNINIHLSRQDLASYIGTTYETVFRLMNDLVAQGLIGVDGKNITLIDEGRLLAVTEESISAP
ncbi:MAG TPA: Crp/Fnr family transcriptional regulator [Chitinophagaceae bacterium]|nr:Crp/Fnr family transcriptional regulator [Chitinophagaceae bacterium]